MYPIGEKIIYNLSILAAWFTDFLTNDNRLPITCRKLVFTISDQTRYTYPYWKKDLNYDKIKFLLTSIKKDKNSKLSLVV